MKYQTIAEICAANEKIRTQLHGILVNLSDAKLNFRVDENWWTIREIVEHLAIVENGMASISASLLKKAAVENLPNDGSAHLSDGFLERAAVIADRRTRKAVAPERVVPTGQLSVAESLAKMDENAEFLKQIRVGLESVNTQTHKFPHPFFGDLSATEWLALIGGHEARHTDQIEEILSNFQ